jgi:hypothetical protein
MLNPGEPIAVSTSYFVGDRLDVRSTDGVQPISLMWAGLIFRSLEQIAGCRPPTAGRASAMAAVVVESEPPYRVRKVVIKATTCILFPL